VHRSLNPSQRALIAAGFLEYEREQAKAGRELEPTSKETFPESGQACDKAGERARSGDSLRKSLARAMLAKSTLIAAVFPFGADKTRLPPQQA